MRDIGQLGSRGVHQGEAIFGGDNVLVRYTFDVVSYTRLLSANPRFLGRVVVS